MVKNQPVIRSSIGTVMGLAIRNHAQRIEINRKAWQSNKAKPIIKQETTASQICTNIVAKQCSEKQGVKNIRYQGAYGLKQARQGDLKELVAWVEERSGGLEGPHGAWH